MASQAAFLEAIVPRTTAAIFLRFSTQNSTNPLPLSATQQGAWSPFGAQRSIQKEYAL